MTECSRHGRDAPLPAEADPGPRGRRGDPRIAAVIGISRLSKMTGASVRALRHYELVGLLSPLRSEDRGRWYSPDQAAAAQTIVLLRRLDVPIPEIKSILGQATVEDRARAATTVLEARAADLSSRLALVREALERTRPELPVAERRDPSEPTSAGRVIDFAPLLRRGP